MKRYASELFKRYSRKQNGRIAHALLTRAGYKIYSKEGDNTIYEHRNDDTLMVIGSWLGKGCLLTYYKEEEPKGPNPLRNVLTFKW